RWGSRGLEGRGHSMQSDSIQHLAARSRRCSEPWTLAFSCDRNPLGRNCDHVDMSKLNCSFRGEGVAVHSHLTNGRNHSQTLCDAERALSIPLALTLAFRDRGVHVWDFILPRMAVAWVV